MSRIHTCIPGPNALAVSYSDWDASPHVRISSRSYVLLVVILYKVLYARCLYEASRSHLHEYNHCVIAGDRNLPAHVQYLYAEYTHNSVQYNTRYHTSTGKF